MERVLYWMTIASTWYDEASRRAREYEMHFKVARSGGIQNIHRRLARRGTPYFQQVIYRRFKRWIPKRKIRIGFKREELAGASERNITIQILRMEYRGRQQVGFPQMSRVISYAKKRRKRRRSP